jgi:hypothetical protein
VSFKENGEIDKVRRIDDENDAGATKARAIAATARKRKRIIRVMDDNEDNPGPAQKRQRRE